MDKEKRGNSMRIDQYDDGARVISLTKGIDTVGYSILSLLR